MKKTKQRLRMREIPRGHTPPAPAFPLFCDFSCPHAGFAPGDVVGACRREQAVYCAFFRRLNDKNSLCLNRKQSVI